MTPSKAALCLSLSVLALAMSGCPNTNPVSCSADSDCLSGSRCCGGRCAEVLADTANCGACGVVCPAANGTATCEVGACRIACDANRGNCDNNLLNGCETDLATDKKHCGACAKACFSANASGVCAARVCGQGPCNPGYADCDQQPGTGCETNIESDVANCGGCGVACTATNGTPKCFGGMCQVASCEADFGDCDGEVSNGCETLLKMTAQHCGTCGITCMDGESCSAGMCGKTGLILYGGSNEASPNGVPVESLARFDPLTKTFEALVPEASNGAPQPRAQHVALWDSAANRMIVYGGVTANQQPDPTLWALDFSQPAPAWTKLVSMEPSPFGRASMCSGFDAANRTLYLFGGRDEMAVDRNDFWKLEVATGVWTLLHGDGTSPSAPPANFGASCAFLPESGHFVLFGGLDFQTFMTSDATWTYATRDAMPAWSQAKVLTPPGPRLLATMFPLSSSLAMYGGADVDFFQMVAENLNDVNTLAFATGAAEWTQETANGSPNVPPARYLAAGATAGERRYLFGGGDVNTGLSFNDLWEFDPVTKLWTELSPSGAPGAPPGQAGATMVAQQ